ncbi:MAG: hypothetical protein AAB425_05010, partial [Bdellovibrionota bacterium]
MDKLELKFEQSLGKGDFAPLGRSCNVTSCNQTLDKSSIETYTVNNRMVLLHRKEVILWGAVFASSWAAFVPPVYSAGSWSEPETSIVNLAPGVTQKTLSRWRMSNDGPAYRTVESKSNARFKTTVSQGRYELYRKQVYHKEKLITFYRSMAMDILDSPFLLIEQSQIAKTPENRFKGSLVLEVFLQKDRKGPALRLALHFNHYLLATGYTLKVFTRGDGQWPIVSSVEGTSLGEAVEKARGELAKKPASKENSLADFSLSLWSESLSHGMLESTQLLAPFLRRTDDLRLKEDSLAKAISLAQSGLAAATTDQVEITQWRDSFKSLSEARNALTKSLNKKKERSMDFLPLADRYLFAIQAALKRSPTPSPSRLQSLHSSADRTAAAIKALLALDRQTSGPDNRVGSLAQEWS